MSLLNIGMSGLAAGQSSLMTTGNNIANVDTAGYSRQQTVQGTKASNQFGNVFIGTGTTLADVRRVYNSYLDAQLQTTTSLNSDSAAYAGQVTPARRLAVGQRHRPERRPAPSSLPRCRTSTPSRVTTRRVSCCSATPRP